MHAYWSCDVLNRLLSHVLETEAQLVAHLIMDVAGYQDSPWLGERLQPGRYVDAVAINVILVADDVANIDTNAELDASCSRHVDIALSHAALNIDRTSYGVHDTYKLNQHPVAGRLDDPSPMLGYLRIDEFLAVCLQLPKRAFLIVAHQPPLAPHFARKYSRNASSNPTSTHVI